MDRMIGCADVDFWKEDHYENRYVERQSICASIEAVEVTTDLGSDDLYYEIRINQGDLITVTVFDADNESLRTGSVKFETVAASRVGAE